MADSRRKKPARTRMRGLGFSPQPELEKKESVSKTHREESRWKSTNSNARKKKRRKTSAASQKFYERVLITIVAVFCFLVVGGSWFIGADKLKDFASGAFELISEDIQNTGNVVLNCRMSKNINTPYCIERKARIKADWRSIERQGGESSIFTLHDGKKRRGRKRSLR